MRIPFLYKIKVLQQFEQLLVLNSVNFDFHSYSSVCILVYVHL